jgi:polar amino acid transport system substrate-binding protein
MRRDHFALAVALIGATLATLAHAQAGSTTTASTKKLAAELHVAAIIAPPFVMEQGGSLTGFSIDLWNAISTRMKRTSTYELEPDVGAIEEAMRSNKVDLTVIPVFINSARDAEFDFSLPIMEAGVQVMVRDSRQSTRAANPLSDMLRLMLSRTTILWLGMAVLLVLIPAHLIWLSERQRGDGMAWSRRYYPGIFEATYWALSTLTTQAEGMPKQWLARAFSIVWMFAGVIFVASYTAQLTTALTVEQIRGAIQGPDDLPGKRVGTLAHTLAVDYLREHRAQVRDFPTIDQLSKALLDKNVDAAFTAAPLLRYFAAHEGRGQVELVGPEINVAPVSIMVQLNSPLRKEIDGALLTLREDGTYQKLYDKWFGSPQ